MFVKEKIFEAKTYFGVKTNSILSINQLLSKQDAEEIHLGLIV